MEKDTLMPYKALLCALNAKYIHLTTAPYCLAAGMRAYAPELCYEVVEGTINEDLSLLQNRIISQKPNAITFSCYIWNIEKTLLLARFIKAALPRTAIILGGPEVSYNADEVLFANEYIDYILCGEGETSVPALLLALYSGKSVCDISGICYRDGGNIITSEPCILTGTPQSPYNEEYLKALKGRIAYLEASRGCPYSCAFCLSGRCGAPRYFDISTVKSNIITLAQSGAKTIKLVDRTFNANPLHANTIIKFILDNYGAAIPCNVCFHFEVAGDILREDTMQLLACAKRGCFQLEIGVQSFNEAVLCAAKRKTDIAKLIANIKRLLAMDNMHIHIDLIAGLKGEDLPTFIEGFNEAYALGANMLQLGFLKLLHGAAMREDAITYPCTYSPLPPYEVISTPYMSCQDLNSLHGVEDALERMYNSGRFRDTLAYVLSVCQLTPYELFFAVGAKPSGITLNEYIEYLIPILQAMPNVDNVLLRDAMVKDYLATNASGRLPAALRIYDDNLSLCAKYLRENGYPQLPNTKRCIAILYGAKSMAFVDYTQKDCISGRYALHILCIDFLNG
ncbi:MAG: DUF4080 domain-containing protein [Oscillospiraceae bacterium]